MFKTLCSLSLDLEIRRSKYKISHSSSTAKVCTDIKISPADFKVIKIIGEGDVGRVYLVQGKAALGSNENKLFAMKGTVHHSKFVDKFDSVEQKIDAQEKKDSSSLSGTRNSGK